MQRVESPALFVAWDRKFHRGRFSIDDMVFGVEVPFKRIAKKAALLELEEV
jgi:hypothetical protein